MGRATGEDGGTHDDGVMDLAFSPDGAALVCAIGDGTATAWDGLALTPKTFAKPSDEMLRTCAYSADGAVVAATLVKAVDGAHRAAVMALAVTATGLASSSGDIDGQGLPNTLSVWT